jgi:hypothetical protein
MREGNEVPTANIARRTGAVVQAVILGIFLFVAVARLVAVQTGARVFLYQAW